MTQETKHTPGPWNSGATLLDQKHGMDWKTGIVANGCIVGRFTQAGSRDKREAEANAYLIASAPELLQALQWVLANHHEGEGEFENVVKAAIAKAEGRTE